MSRVIFLLLISLFSIRLYSQDIVTDRPDQTESATSIPKGAFQLESGILIRHNGEELREILAPSNLFRYGLLENLELRVNHEYIQLKYGSKNISQTGIGDLQAGFKYQFFNNSGTELAILSHLSFPSGTAGTFSAGQYGTINRLLIAHEINERIGLGCNLGYDYFDHGVFAYTLALGFRLTERVGYYLEAFGDISDGMHSSNMDTGFTYLLNDTLQLDFSFGTGINVDMNFLSMGISWLILDDHDN